jgi:hypothetical protein
MYDFPGGDTDEIAQGEPLLSVHIPSGAPLSREELTRSYDFARKFFAEHFPEYRYTKIYCHTWLLSPKLKSIVKPGGGIDNFQRDYRILWTDGEADDCVGWVFGRKYENPEQLPEKTTLQKAIKEMMLSGGHLGAAAGIVG